MKKTIDVNIGGLIFHLDEDAFERLNQYLESVRTKYEASEKKDEIVSDVEKGIAKILTVKLNEIRQVVTLQDIEEVIAEMESPTATKEEAKKDKTHNARRFYRDPDNKVFGGVCAGIAAYFNVSVVWIRLVFLLLVLVFGMSPIIYIILWIVIPQATTIAEKLEMHGEKINVSNIEKTIEAEIEHLKQKLNELKNDAKSTYKEKSKQTIEKGVSFFVEIIRYLVRAVAIFVGIIFVLVGIFLIVGLITTFFRNVEVISFSFANIINYPLNILKVMLPSPDYLALGITGIILVVGIPLIMLIYAGIKLIFGIKTKKRIIGVSSLTLWLAGLIFCGIAGYKVLNNQTVKERIQKQEILKPSAKAIVYIDLAKDNILDSILKPINRQFVGEWNIGKYNNNEYFFGVPSLNIIKCGGNIPVIEINKFARGNNTEMAIKNCESISFDFNQPNDSILLLEYFKLNDTKNWSDQSINLTIKLPINYTFILSKSLTQFIRKDNQFITEDMIGKKLIMTENGIKEKQ